MKVTEKTGKVVAVKQVSETDEIMLITTSGKIIRMNGQQYLGDRPQYPRCPSHQPGARRNGERGVAKLAESDEEEEKDPAP
jgi:hypothetical protein